MTISPELQAQEAVAGEGAEGKRRARRREDVEEKENADEEE